MGEFIPIITVDGPSGSGKGTLCRLLARQFGWHLLDSGALYRVVAIAAENHGVSFADQQAMEVIAAHLDVQFEAGDNESAGARIVLEGDDVTDMVRSEITGAKASEVAVIPVVRNALLQRQRAFKRQPGLVADGRDMGTVVFPESPLKIFLTATPEERAQRRYLQLKEKSENVTLSRLISDVSARDKRDTERAIAPLKAAEDAISVDTTGIGIDEVFQRVLQEAEKVGFS